MPHHRNMVYRLAAGVWHWHRPSLTLAVEVSPTATMGESSDSSPTLRRGHARGAIGTGLHGHPCHEIAIQITNK